MQATSSLGQNIADDIKGSIPISSAQQNIPGTSSLSTGQAPSYSGIQEKSPLGLQGQQFQQNLPAQQYSNLGQQNLPAQQYSNLGQQNLGAQQYSNLGQQNLGAQQYSNLGQQNLQNQQYSNLQGQQMGYQQGLSSQQFLDQNLQNQQGLESQKFLNQQQPFQQWFPQQQQQFTQQSFLQQGQLLPATQFQVIPAILEHKDCAPVIQERIRREEVEEIHPVIHREREKTEIHKITQPVHTSAVLGVVTEEATLPAKFSEMRTPSMLPPATVLPKREELSAQKMRVETAPVVIETERKKIIEEVTPLVYREVVEPHLTKLTQPIYERIVEGDVYVSEIRPAQVMATSMEACTAVPLQSTQFLQQTQNVPIQIPVNAQMPILTKNIGVAETFVKEGVPITTTANRGLFGRRAV